MELTFEGAGTADVYLRLGNAAWIAGGLPEAERAWRRAIEIDQGCADAWGNLGLLLQTVGHHDDALRCYYNAMGLAPNNANNLVNLGSLTYEMGYFDNGIRLYERALELEPGHVKARHNLSIARLTRFDFASGWDLHESRFEHAPGSQPVSRMREYPIPWWDGKRVGHLYVWPEQGVGDTILFTTLLPALAARAERVTVEMDVRLVAAYRRSPAMPPNVDFITKGEPMPEGCDAHIALGSLPRLLRPTLDSFKRQPRAILEALPFKGVVGADDHRKRVAISWRSFQPAKNQFVRDKKSAPLSAFAALGGRSDLQLIDVQYGPVSGERAGCTFPLWTPEIDLFNDIEGVMSVLRACDVVVTTSNVTAHFAGALGIPTYLVYLRANPPFFYWQPLWGRSLWYPSVVVVTGEGLTDWSRALEIVSEVL